MYYYHNSQNDNVHNNQRGIGDNHSLHVAIGQLLVIMGNKACT